MEATRLDIEFGADMERDKKILHYRSLSQNRFRGSTGIRNLAPKLNKFI